MTFDWGSFSGGVVGAFVLIVIYRLGFEENRRIESADKYINKAIDSITGFHRDYLKLILEYEKCSVRDASPEDLPEIYPSAGHWLSRKHDEILHDMHQRLRQLTLDIKFLDLPMLKRIVSRYDQDRKSWINRVILRLFYLVSMSGHDSGDVTKSLSKAIKALKELPEEIQKVMDKFRIAKSYDARELLSLASAAKEELIESLRYP